MAYKVREGRPQKPRHGVCGKRSLRLARPPLVRHRPTWWQVRNSWELRPPILQDCPGRPVLALLAWQGMPLMPPVGKSRVPLPQTEPRSLRSDRSWLFCRCRSLVGVRWVGSPPATCSGPTAPEAMLGARLGAECRGPSSCPPSRRWSDGSGTRSPGPGWKPVPR